MPSHTQEFVTFLLETGALRFGEFTLKSGRISPYFFNSGLFSDGLTIGKLGYFYASTIQEHTLQYDVVFGPAYKGIPLAVATASALSEHWNVRRGYAFDRKEAKEYGDKSVFVGAELKKGTRVVMIDDVMTTGATKEEALKKLSAQGAVCVGLIIALDRMEQGADGKDAVQEFSRTTGVPVYAIATIEDVYQELLNRKEGEPGYLTQDIRDRMDTYRKAYGVTRTSTLAA